MDAVYGCDTCRTTIGRAGCPTHRDTVTYADPSNQEPGRYEYSGGQLVITHCRHMLDLRVTPRCFLCRPEGEPEPIFPTLVEIENRLDTVIRLLTSIEYHVRTKR